MKRDTTKLCSAAAAQHQIYVDRSHAVRTRPHEQAVEQALPAEVEAGENEVKETERNHSLHIDESVSKPGHVFDL